MSRYTELDRLRLFLRYADRCARKAIGGPVEKRDAYLESIIMVAAGICTCHDEPEEEADMQAAKLEECLKQDCCKAAVAMKEELAEREA